MKNKKRRAQKAPDPVPARPDEMKDGRETGRASRGGPVRIVAGLALLALAVYLRSRRTSVFYNITTSDYSANNMLRDVADAWPVIRSAGGALFKTFARDSLLPVFAALLPAVYLITAGLSRIRTREKGPFAFLEAKKNRAISLVVLFIVAFSICLGVHGGVRGRYPVMGDEFCYMFGADQLASGKLYVESPPLRDHFQAWSIINDGRWYSKVTIGWPLVLAAGRLVHLEYLINPILAALCVVLLFLIGDSLYGLEAGVLAALWGLMTPFFIMLSGTYFPHTATALLSLLFIHLLLRTFEKEGWIFPVLAGLSMAFLLTVRPADAGVLFIGLLPMMAYQVLRSGDKKRALPKVAVLFAFFFAGIGLLMLINKVQNGDPLLFGYQKYHADEAWGFGVNGHTFIKGLWNTVYSLMRIGSWGVPFAGLFLLISLFMKRWSARLLAVPVVGSIVLYAGYYTLATFEIGPRYYLPMYLLALVPASGGAILVRDFLKKKRAPGAATLVAALALSTLIFMAVGAWPRMLASVKAQTAIVAEVPRFLDDPPVESPSLIFLRDHIYLKNIFLDRNYPHYRDQKNVFALYLMPEDNRKVMEMFPSRTYYTTVVRPETGKVDLVPYVDNSESAGSYFAAGLNYVEFDPQQAVRAFAKALELAPGDPTVMMSLARAYDLDGDRANAVDVYSQVLRSGADPPRELALFYLANDLRELGRTREALGVYEELAASDRDFPYRSRADGWIKKLSR